VGDVNDTQCRQDHGGGVGVDACVVDPNHFVVVTEVGTSLKSFSSIKWWVK
jgi:hypothetical protein